MFSVLSVRGTQMEWNKQQEMIIQAALLTRPTCVTLSMKPQRVFYCFILWLKGDNNLYWVFGQRKDAWKKKKEQYSSEPYITLMQVYVLYLN